MFWIFWCTRGRSRRLHGFVKSQPVHQHTYFATRFKPASHIVSNVVSVLRVTGCSLNLPDFDSAQPVVTTCFQCSYTSSCGPRRAPWHSESSGPGSPRARSPTLLSKSCAGSRPKSRSRSFFPAAGLPSSPQTIVFTVQVLPVVRHLYLIEFTPVSGEPSSYYTLWNECLYPAFLASPLVAEPSPASPALAPRSSAKATSMASSSRKQAPRQLGGGGRGGVQRPQRPSKHPRLPSGKAVMRRLRLRRRPRGNPSNQKPRSPRSGKS